MMVSRKPIALLAALVVLSLTAASAAGAATGHSLFHSRQLWATIDVCTPKDQPNTLGIRGSMPSDGFASDKMYMRFRLQYQNPTTKQWIDDPARGADSGFLTVGPASSPRQNGLSFQLTPVPGKPAFTLRGVVSFQWRTGVHVVHSASRPTTAGHQSLAGADPAGFSAATCVIG
ncbi:MAG TPA: hypothetical protein VGH56_07200 [Solirubrobacteraceae bacterium]|jgi:hypothetical protein